MQTENKALEDNIATMSEQVAEQSARMKTVSQDFKSARERNQSLKLEHEQVLQKLERLRLEKDSVCEEEMSAKLTLVEKQVSLLSCPVLATLYCTVIKNIIGGQKYWSTTPNIHCQFEAARHRQP